ncbi:hypothetical protein STXM2123_131 [Streptomyces sp. F-3]|uniref:hypothetical protein n=1 Tax=Streptomyces TaxID=1883 RepID=UPI0007C25F31|nr:MULTISPECIES: hypothetical protein [Streptomyces]GAT79430.1 hypothetical protein STXM2123_131 [Streptomyces sp. F-3]
MINPGGIPQYTGDFDKLSKAVTELRKRAISIRRNGQDVHSRFQATAAYYKAPEADQLFSSTRPVMDTADTFAGHIESLADALDTFAAEAKPHAERLKRLKEEAIAFVDSVEGDDDWTNDQKKVDEHQALMDGVAEAVAGFQEAESNAVRKISAISPALCRPGPKPVSADTLKSMDNLPWGSPEGRTHERWSLGWWGHGIKSWVWDGIVKDSLWGGFVGLGILVDDLAGINGSQAQQETWDALRRTLVGVYAYGMEAAGQGDHLSDWQRGSKAYTKEFGKGLIAYDQWQDDPARAHAVTSFNLLTLFAGPAAGLAKVSKTGRVAEAAGTLAKVGDALDPISGTAMAARGLSNLPKVSEVLANATAHLKVPKPHFPDTALDLSDRYRIDKQGNLIPLNPDGTPNPTPAVREPAAAERFTGALPGDREPVGVGARTGEAAARVGGGLSPESGQGGASYGTEPAMSAHDASTGSHGERASGNEQPQSGTAHHGVEHSSGDGRADHDAAQSRSAAHGRGEGNGGADSGPLASLEAPSSGDSGMPMVRGGETEQRVRDAIKGIPGRQRPKPDTLERALDRLASRPGGQKIAEIIASGKFNECGNYGDVISAMGARREQMFQPATDQLVLADDLVRGGVPEHAIDFEYKKPAGADVDVRVKDESGDVYAYQMKRLNNPKDPISEITRGKYLAQLKEADAKYYIMLVDGARGTRKEWMANGSYDVLMDVHNGSRGKQGKGITFVIRLADGNLVVPPGSKVDPKDIL